MAVPPGCSTVAAHETLTGAGIVVYGKFGGKVIGILEDAYSNMEVLTRSSEDGGSCLCRWLCQFAGLGQSLKPSAVYTARMIWVIWAIGLDQL